jgi:hypothetical protein
VLADHASTSSGGKAATALTVSRLTVITLPASRTMYSSRRESSKMVLVS